MPNPPTKPLYAKLGLDKAHRIMLINQPKDYFDLVGPVQLGLDVVEAETNLDFIHYFETEAEKLNGMLLKLKRRLNPKGMMWISWYKMAAKMQTDITEDTIRAVALPLGLVDVKVCSVSEQWSGLKLVIRLEERKI